LLSVSRARLTVVAVGSLFATALLGLAVSRGFGAYGLERHAIHLLGRPPNIYRWGWVATFLAVPVIGAVLIASLIFGEFHGIVLRVLALAGFAGAAYLIGELIIKPVVQERIEGELSFPSGNVTIVCAVALAMWIAVFPFLGNWARVITFVLGATWTVLMALAVVGAFWHTPLDGIGSVFLSVGVVTAGAALIDGKWIPPPRGPEEPERVLEGVSSPATSGDSL
jgi:hypothetical protein